MTVGLTGAAEVGEGSEYGTRLNVTEFQQAIHQAISGISTGLRAQVVAAMQAIPQGTVFTADQFAQAFSDAGNNFSSARTYFNNLRKHNPNIGMCRVYPPLLEANLNVGYAIVDDGNERPAVQGQERPVFYNYVKNNLPLISHKLPLWADDRLKKLIIEHEGNKLIFWLVNCLEGVNLDDEGKVNIDRKVLAKKKNSDILLAQQLRNLKLLFTKTGYAEEDVWIDEDGLHFYYIANSFDSSPANVSQPSSGTEDRPTTPPGAANS